MLLCAQHCDAKIWYQCVVGGQTYRKATHRVGLRGPVLSGTDAGSIIFSLGVREVEVAFPAATVLWCMGAELATGGKVRSPVSWPPRGR